MAWLPASRVLVMKVAVASLSRGTVWVPPPGPSMVNVTVPRGLPAPGATGVTVAVTVTGSPNVEGSGEDTTVVVVAARSTVWTSVPVEAVKFGSPL